MNEEFPEVSLNGFTDDDFNPGDIITTDNGTIWRRSYRDEWEKIGQSGTHPFWQVARAGNLHLVAHGLERDR